MQDQFSFAVITKERPGYVMVNDLSQAEVLNQMPHIANDLERLAQRKVNKLHYATESAHVVIKRSPTRSPVTDRELEVIRAALSA